MPHDRKNHKISVRSRAVKAYIRVKICIMEIERALYIIVILNIIYMSYFFHLE